MYSPQQSVMGMMFGDPLVALIVAVKQLLHLSAKKLRFSVTTAL